MHSARPLQALMQTSWLPQWHMQEQCGKENLLFLVCLLNKEPPLLSHILGLASHVAEVDLLDSIPSLVKRMIPWQML